MYKLRSTIRKYEIFFANYCRSARLYLGRVRGGSAKSFITCRSASLGRIQIPEWQCLAHGKPGLISDDQFASALDRMTNATKSPY